MVGQQFLELSIGVRVPVPEELQKHKVLVKLQFRDKFQKHVILNLFQDLKDSMYLTLKF
jgi:hypothetical protein